jgi:hypothetical protein
MTCKMRLATTVRALVAIDEPRMLSDAELGELFRLLQAKSPLGELSNMQARVVFELAQQRGYRIIPPTKDDLPSP